jgi:hypothetical protein
MPTNILKGQNPEILRRMSDYKKELDPWHEKIS